MHPVATIPAGNVLGECVLWDEADQSLWWTDIKQCRLHRLDWQSRRLDTHATPHRLASFGFVEGRREVIAAFDCGFALFDPVSGATHALHRPDGLLTGQRMNDGRVDRAGRFWAGSMAEDDGPSSACLYCVDAAGVHNRLDGIGIGNGLSWSPDGSVCYFADSRAQTIWRFDVVDGAMTNRTEFARAAASAYPDGATVDAEGYLWSAQWDGGCVIRYAPDGSIDRVLEVAVSRPTCVAFGGPALDLLFVTTARDGLDHPESGAGDLFVYNVGVRGLKESRFKIGAWPKTPGCEG